MESLSNYVETINEEKVKVKDIYPMQILNKDILQKIVDTSNPKAPAKDKGGKGLYAFAELLKKESALLDIGKKPLVPIYVCFMSNEGKDPKDSKFYGIAGFSVNYFTTKNKAVVSEIDEDILKQMKGFLHILIWQTDPEYAKAGLAKTYVETLKKAAKELNAPAITIKKVDDKVNELYKGLGFKEHDKLKDYLLLPLKQNKKENNE